jgi:hypothetical protein
MRHVEQSLAALDAIELDTAEKLAFWGIVDDYVFGSVLRTVESLTHAAAAEDNGGFRIQVQHFHKRR